MYCAKCGAVLPDEAKFCHKCGWQVPSSGENTRCDASETVRASEKRPTLKCPKCGSEDIQYSTITETKGLSAWNSCCGYIMLGPLGLLCGLSDMGKTTTKEFWICHSCGAKFQADSAIDAQKKRISDLEKYNSLLQDAPEDLERRRAEVHQEFLDVSKVFDGENKKFQLENLQYHYLCLGTPAGCILIVLGIALFFLSGSLSVALLSLLGLILLVVASNKEAALFEEAAPQTLRELKKKRDYLREQDQKMEKQLKAKHEKKRIEDELDHGK